MTVHSTIPRPVTLIPFASPSRVVISPGDPGGTTKSLISLVTQMVAPESQSTVKESSSAMEALILCGAVKAANMK